MNMKISVYLRFHKMQNAQQSDINVKISVDKYKQLIDTSNIVF